MGEYKYVTNRILENKKGEEKGKIRVLVKADSNTAEVSYVCPECGFSEETKKEWKRPFSVKCSKCGFLMRLPRLKDKK